MGGRRILSDAQLDEMCALREKGWGTDRIAAHFTAKGSPISKGSIHWQCLRLGADAPKRFHYRRADRPDAYQRNGRAVRTFTAEEDAKLLALEAEGASYSAMARQLDRKPNSIKGRLYTLARHAARAEEA